MSQAKTSYYIPRVKSNIGEQELIFKFNEIGIGFVSHVDFVQKPHYKSVFVHCYSSNTYINTFAYDSIQNGEAYRWYVSEKVYWIILKSQKRTQESLALEMKLTKQSIEIKKIQELQVNITGVITELIQQVIVEMDHHTKQSGLLFEYDRRIGELERRIQNLVDSSSSLPSLIDLNDDTCSESSMPSLIYDYNDV
jgi:hypothetical protein